MQSCHYLQLTIYYYRGAKGSYWQGGVRADSFIWSRLLQQPGRTFDGLMHVTDWLPTLLHAATGTSPKVLHFTCGFR